MRKDPDGKRVHIEIDFWLYDDGSAIQVSSGARPDFHVKVKPAPLKRQRSSITYRRLAWLLRDAGAPAPHE
jgi:hypothetical protein